MGIASRKRSRGLEIWDDEDLIILYLFIVFEIFVLYIYILFFQLKTAKFSKCDVSSRDL